MPPEKTEPPPRATCTGNQAKFAFVFPEVCEQTYRQTYTLIAIIRCPFCGRVIIFAAIYASSTNPYRTIADWSPLRYSLGL